MTMQVAGNNLQALSMDHHGLVAALCKDLGIAEKIDSRLGVQDKRRIVSPGKAVAAMILNGLGFTNRRLYLAPQFFETKPIDLLLDESIIASDITDYTLGHTLEEIFAYGASRLFAEVAFETALEHNLLNHINHLDTTSFTVHGEYDVGEGEKNPSIVEIRHGHSKDNRPDLKQVVLSLVVNGPSSIPIYMEPLNGNNSDKNIFHETIKKVRAFQKEIDLDINFKWVADSALYTKDKLLKNNSYTWLTRVPETIKEAKELARKEAKEIEWKEQGAGYKISPFVSHYGEIEQRWLLVYSEQAYKREEKTLEKNIVKKEDCLKKVMWHLGNEIFSCALDAKAALKLKKIEKLFPLHNVESEIVPILKYAKPGKPKEGEEKVIVGYRIESTISRNVEEIKKKMNMKGRFILATNDLDRENYSDERILTEYKEQQNVEGGFRFLKDPWFMVDSIFLKSPRRIEALMMVMTLCLLVYNVAQYKLRKMLQEKKETLPNQLGKQIQNPTMRWVFQIMEGISIIRFFGEKIHDMKKEIIANLNELRKKIINLFGNTACKIYGLAPM